MMAEIKPSQMRGRVTAPPSKSMAHRLLIGAGLSEGESAVRRLAFSEDVKATIACLTALGADIRLDNDTAYVRGVDVSKPLGRTAVLPCGECGSTLRFFTPLCMLGGEERVLTGTPYLMCRPMSVYEDIAGRYGMRFEREEGSLTVRGALRSGVYEVLGDISSQFISGLLFALPLLDGDSEICVLPPVESKPYIAMTAAALRTFGITVDTDGDTYRIKGAQRYAPADVTVEGDYSNAAFFEALNYAGGDVTVEGLLADSLQGDQVYKILFQNIKQQQGSIDISDCPDLGPILFVVAALCSGGTFTGTRRLRIKESDRAAAMQAELAKFGVRVEVLENSVTVHGGELHAPVQAVESHGDHRIVMALAVLATVTGAVINGAEDVRKSFPRFFEEMKNLGAEVQIYGMDQ